VVYADGAALDAYTGQPGPPGVDRLLARASELIDYATFGKIDPNNEEHLAAAEKAVCAQVEQWLSMDESIDVTGKPAAFSIGNFSMTFGAHAREPNRLAPRARSYLLLAGLLHRGVSIR